MAAPGGPPKAAPTPPPSPPPAIGIRVEQLFKNKIEIMVKNRVLMLFLYII
jgi:hypothetical protein